MDGKDPGTHETLSREIYRRNATRTIRGGDFSTSLRFGRNDVRGARCQRHLERSCMSIWMVKTLALMKR